MPNDVTLTTPTDREVVITRQFDAPRELVWEAIYTPALLRRWMYGPPGWEMTTCEDEARVGGTFRRVWTGPDGSTMSQSGVYREFVPPGRCVRTQVFEVGGVPRGGDQLGTIVLDESGGKTTLTMTFLFESKEVRDGSVASGMEKGMAAGFERLDEILDPTSASA